MDEFYDVEVDMQCVLADGSNTDYPSIPPDEDMEDCDVAVEYSYIVTNTSPNPQTVKKLVQNFNGNDKDLIGDLGSTVLGPVEEVVVTDTVEVEICEYTTFTATTQLIIDGTSNVITCIDTAKYYWKPDKICELDVGITC